MNVRFSSCISFNPLQTFDRENRVNIIVSNLKREEHVARQMRSRMDDSFGELKMRADRASNDSLESVVFKIVAFGARHSKYEYLQFARITYCISLTLA